MSTARLYLVAFTPEHLLALLNSKEAFENCTGRRIAEGIRELYTSGDIPPDWFEMLRTSTTTDPWTHGFAIILRESNMMIGTVGFKGKPDEDGMVEIAYGIAPGFQGQGYATEAAEAGVRFAFDDDRVRVVRAHTLATNNASTRVLAKCQFQFIGDVIDPADGPVWRWERPKVPTSLA